jgi:hypothetical protein
LLIQIQKYLFVDKIAFFSPWPLHGFLPDRRGLSNSVKESIRESRSISEQLGPEAAWRYDFFFAAKEAIPRTADCLHLMTLSFAGASRLLGKRPAQPLGERMAHDPFFVLDGKKVQLFGK